MKHYYVYRITNIVEQKHYYGKRCSLVPPEKDLGIKYFSSSKDALFIQDQKLQPSHYKYKVVKKVATAKEAVELEIKLHAKFDVGKNPKFYNIVKQTSIKFDSTGVHHSEKTLKLLSLRRKGRKLSEEAKDRIRQAKYNNTWNIGRKHTKEAIINMKCASKKGIDHHNHVLVDIFNATTKMLIAKAVVLSVWCGDDKSLRANLAATLKADLTKPSSRKNVCSAKGLYARYSNV